MRTLIFPLLMAAGLAQAATVQVPGYRSNFTVTRLGDGSVSVVRLRDGGTQLTGQAADTFQFQDAVVFFDDTGIPAQAYRLYQAAFNRVPDPAGLGYWTEALQGGLPLLGAASAFYGSAEFQATYGQVSDLQFVTLLYKNVLGRAPDQAGSDYWVQALGAGAPRDALLRDFSESQENRDRVAGTIKAGVTYYPFAAAAYTAPLQGFQPAPTAEASSQVAPVTVAAVLGHYQRLPVENEYHDGNLVLESGQLAWKNLTGHPWTLTDDLAHGKLLTDSSSPYHTSDHPDITVVLVGGKVAGIRISGELYVRDGIALPSGVTANETVPEEVMGLGGFVFTDMGDVPEGYTYGFSQYLALYPTVDGAWKNYQIGQGFFVNPDNVDYQQALLPPDNNMRITNPNSGPSWQALFQTIEGGPGTYGSSHFTVQDPKFHIVGTVDGYEHGNGAPGWIYPNAAAGARALQSVAQLSNRVLTPPDGYTFRQGTSGDFLGYAWMALPLTEPRAGATAPVGNQSWTLFFNTSNFHGPLVFWVPDAFARLSQTWSPASGRGLDARPGRVQGTVVEINTTPAFANGDATGKYYLRNARVLFPVDADNTTWLAADRAHYGAAALFTPLQAWFNGGTAISGTFDRTATTFIPFSKASFELSQNGMKVNGLDNYVTAAVMATPGGGAAYGLKWTHASTAGVLPEYFRQNGSALDIIGPSEVPAETMLTARSFATASAGVAYTSPDSGTESWTSPAPAAGPFQATLADGSVVTYSWYRFIDQPVLQGFGWSAAEKARLQQRVELLHKSWANTHEFMAPPSSGTLATLDAALLVTPPKGLEIGYVPVVTRQEAGR
ncbi:MAG: DUF4214 domain-containing protein [Telluria sp.]